MSKLKVDLALVQKYNVPGPRYTSYPPATRFTDQVAWPALAEEILQNNKTERHLSLYFHIRSARRFAALRMHDRHHDPEPSERHLPGLFEERAGANEHAA